MRGCSEGQLKLLLGFWLTEHQLSGRRVSFEVTLKAADDTTNHGTMTKK